MSELNTLINNEISDIISDILEKDNLFRKTLEENLKKQITEAIEDSFKWGDVNKIIKEKIKSVMVPAIEKYNFEKYITGLDQTLSSLITSEFTDNNKILSNFKREMSASSIDNLSLDNMFNEYKRYIAENIETTGRTVSEDFSEGPEYEPVETIMSIERIESSYTSSSKERYNITFHIEDEDVRDPDEYAVEIELYRYSFDKPDQYRIISMIDKSSLRQMSDFEAYVAGICSAGITITMTSERELSESVTPDEKPEATYC